MGAGAVHDRVGAYRGGGMAAIAAEKQECGTETGTGALRRRVVELELRNALMREVMGIVKGSRRQAGAPSEPGEDQGRSTGCARRFHRAVWPAGRRSP